MTPGDQETTKRALEEGLELLPRFDKDGLLPCIAVDAGTREVLMLAYMSRESLQRTLESGDAWYFSRSRQALWRKGDTSGQRQRVVEMRVDCDQDALLIAVEVAGDGAACHTGRRSCFYRIVTRQWSNGATLRFAPEESGAERNERNA